MTDAEKPSNTPFWTWDIILLVALNVVLLGIIAAAAIPILHVLKAPLKAWLAHRFGL